MAGSRRASRCPAVRACGPRSGCWARASTAELARLRRDRHHGVCRPRAGSGHRHRARTGLFGRAGRVSLTTSSSGLPWSGSWMPAGWLRDRVHHLPGPQQQRRDLDHRRASRAGAGRGDPNNVLKMDVNVVSYAGFVHNFENASRRHLGPAGLERLRRHLLLAVRQQQRHDPVRGRARQPQPRLHQDDAERWSIDLIDNFSGWQEIEAPLRRACTARRSATARPTTASA
jgi:hypothetical protein